MAGNEYKIAIKIAGALDKSLQGSIKEAQAALGGLNNLSLAGMQNKVFSAFNSFSKDPVAAVTALRHSVNEAMSGMGNKTFGQNMYSAATAGLQMVNRSAQNGFVALEKTAAIAAKGTAAAMGATVVAMGAAAGASVRVGQEFESAMSSAAATASATPEQYAQMEAAARAAGRSTSKTAAEAANALEYMALAGWNVSDSTKALPSILKLSEASGMDLARTSDLVTDSMAATGTGIGELSSFLDVATRAQNKSNQTAEQLMESWLGVGGTMKNLGVPVEESATALGMLANRGIKGTEAGTALNAIMVNLTTGTGQAGKMMKSLGLSAFDSEGNFKGLEATLQEVNQATQGMTEEQRNATLAAIGGKHHLDALNDLMAGLNTVTEDGRTEWAALSDELQNSSGALNEMRNMKMDNLAGNMAEFKSAAADLGIGIYQGINAPLREMAMTGTEAFRVLGEALESGGFEGLASAAGQVIPDLIAQFLEAVPQFLQVGQMFLTSLLEGILASAPRLAAGAVQIIVQLANWFMQTLPLMLQVGMTLILHLLQGLVAAAPQLIQGALLCIRMFISFFVSNLPMIVKLGVELILQLIVGLLKAIPDIILAIPQIVSAIREGFFNVDWIAVGVEIISAIWEGIKSIGSGLKDMVVGLFTGGSSNLVNTKDMTSAANNTGLQTSGALGDGMTAGIASVISSAEGYGLGATTALGNGALLGSTGLTTTGEMSAAALGTGIDNGLQLINSGVTASGQELVSNLGSGISENAYLIESNIADLSMAMSNGLSDTWETLKTDTALAFEGINTAVTTGMQTIQTTIQTGLTTNIIQTITNAVTQIQMLISNAFLGWQFKMQEFLLMLNTMLMTFHMQLMEFLMLNLATLTEILFMQLQAWIEMFREYGALAIQIAVETGEAIVEVFMSVDLAPAGAHMMQGLINGMESMRGAVIATAQSIAAAAAAAINSALKIGSPSKLTTETGRFTGEGLAIGLMRMARQVDTAARTLAGAAVAPFMGSVRGMAIPEFSPRTGVFDNLMTGFEGGGVQETDNSASIVYSPTNHYHFDGGAPTREDIAAAERMSLEEFRKLMRENEWQNKRVAFG